MKNFDRELIELGKYWRLAVSLCCPECGNGVWGNGVYTWCRTYNCKFYCTFDDTLIKCKEFFENAYTIRYLGTIHQIAERRFIVIGKQQL